MLLKGDELTRFPIDLLRVLHAARRAVILTGAGISAESGIPTFREALTGLWSRYRPEELATREAFQRDPRRVWEWYAFRRKMAAEAAPNPGHYAIARMGQHVPQLTLITQNVDGLHARAGSPQVIELHGNLGRVKCFQEDRPVDHWQETGELPPRCPYCGGYLRPDVVWFGENLPPAALAMAIEAASNCEVFLSVGTSALVEPAASLPLRAQEQGAVLVEVNPQATPLTQRANFVLQGPAGVVLPSLVEAVWGQTFHAPG